MAQDAQASRHAAGTSFDITAAADRTQGDVVVVGELVAVALRAYDSGANSSLHVEGIFDVVKISDDISAGDKVYWDPTGDPVGGTAGTGGATTTAGALKQMGIAVADAGAAAETVRVLLGN